MSTCFPGDRLGTIREGVIRIQGRVGLRTVPFLRACNGQDAVLMIETSHRDDLAFTGFIDLKTGRLSLNTVL